MGIETNAVEEVRSDIRTFTEEQVNPIKERLLSLEERNSSTNDETVIELEKRLIDGEQKLEAMDERIRLAQVEGGLIPAIEKKSEPFKGVIFKDIDETRRGFVNGETRTMTLGTTLTSTGKLEAEEASMFIDFLVEETATLSRIQTRRMRNQIANLDTITVGTRKLVGAGSATPIAETTTAPDANALSVAQRQLNTTEVVWGENITLQFLEDNIEQDGVEGHVVSMVARQFGNDLNDLGWNGDAATGEFLAINTGYRALAAADGGVNDYDASAGGTDGADATAKETLNGMLKTLPSKYRTISDLTYFMTPAFAQSYADDVSGLVTALGDQTLINGLPRLSYFGIPIVPDAAIVATTNTFGTLTPASNLVFGIQRDVTYDTEWKPRERHIELTWTARIDFQHVYGAVMVQATGIPTSYNA